MKEDTGNVTLIGKLVRVVDATNGINNLSILFFMYPNYLIRDDIFYDNDNDVIYVGKYSKDLKKELENGTRSFIGVCNQGTYDVDFTDRSTIVSILYSKWNRKPSEQVMNALESMSEDDFWKYFKTYWVIGRSSIEESDVTLYNLYMTLGKQKKDILKVYFKLRENYSDSNIFSGVLSFIEKSMNLEQVSTQNGRYLKLLQDFNSEYGDKIKPIIQQTYTIPITSDSDRVYRTIFLLSSLGKGVLV